MDRSGTVERALRADRREVADHDSATRSQTRCGVSLVARHHRTAQVAQRAARDVRYDDLQVGITERSP